MFNVTIGNARKHLFFFFDIIGVLFFFAKLTPKSASCLWILDVTYNTGYLSIRFLTKAMHWYSAKASAVNAGTWWS